MKKNCTTCTRPHDHPSCLECQASATDEMPAPMWKGEKVDDFHAAVERYREEINKLPDSQYRRKAHAMLDELTDVYNATKKPA